MSAASLLMARKRSAKVNAKQKNILLQSMVDNPLVYSRRITAEFTINHYKAFWRNLCAVLNVYGPPKKTVDSWKKAWKDIRARYVKAGIGLKEFNSIIKRELAGNTKLLLEKADQLYTMPKRKVDIEQALRDSISSETNNSEFLSTDMEISCTKNKKNPRNLSEVQLDENQTILNVISNTEEYNAVKAEIADDDFCEIAYEEILESDSEDLNDSDTMDHSDTSMKRKSDSQRNGFLTTDDSELESEVEILKRSSTVKKSKLSSESVSSNTIPSCSNHLHRTESKSVQDSSMLNELLVELRQHNKIQSEKLAFDKKRFETKKRFLEQSLSVKKDIAKAHNLLAKSVKTFIDNISFNA